MEATRPNHQAPAETQSRECCVGVDVPGVGVAHAQDCQSLEAIIECPDPNYDLRIETYGPDAARSKALPSSEGLPGSSPVASALNGEGELAQLLFAARDLADANIEIGRDATICKECLWATAKMGCIGLLSHALSCRTGRVLKLIAELTADKVHQSKTKEDAKERGGDGAGDGSRPRFIELVCRKCGMGGGVWEYSRGTGVVHPSWLSANELLAADSLQSRSYTLYAHCCGVSVECGGVYLRDRALSAADGGAK